MKLLLDAHTLIWAVDDSADMVKNRAGNAVALKGGCFCGAIRYAASGTPFHETNCHCSICRRTTGAPFVAWFSVPRTGFRFVRGTPTAFRSSDRATRRFCPNCGTQLTFEHDDTADEIDITTCSLDDSERLPPKDHSYTSSRLAWIKPGDGLPEYPEARDPES